PENQVVLMNILVMYKFNHDESTHLIALRLAPGWVGKGCRFWQALRILTGGPNAEGSRVAARVQSHCALGSQGHTDGAAPTRSTRRRRRSSFYILYAGTATRSRELVAEVANDAAVSDMGGFRTT